MAVIVLAWLAFILAFFVLVCFFIVFATLIYTLTERNGLSCPARGACERGWHFVHQKWNEIQKWGAGTQERKCICNGNNNSITSHAPGQKQQSKKKKKKGEKKSSEKSPNVSAPCLNVWMERVCSHRHLRLRPSAFLQCSGRQRVAPGRRRAWSRQKTGCR